mgnify:CR=1 FL=1
MKTTVPVRQPPTPKNENKDNVKKVTDFVKSKLGCGYAYGSEGQTLSPDLLKYFKSKFKDNVKDSTKQWMNKECYDCSGLVMKALAQAGISVHHSAHYTWTEDMKKRGDIKDIPNDKLCLVFRKGKDGTMSHIGVYLGNGKVFEDTTGWKVRKCVISDISTKGIRSLNGKKNLKWTYHGRLNYIDYSDLTIDIFKTRRNTNPLEDRKSVV